MKATVFDITGKSTGEVALSKSMFGKKWNPTLVATAIRVYLGNQRSAHAKSKTRAEVAGTTKKMWSQKGTGNARHGSAKAPQFVGGGKAHGPSGFQSYKGTLTKKARAAALSIVLSRFAQENAMLAVEKVSSLEPKTKQAKKLLVSLQESDKNLQKAKKVAVITTGEAASVKAFRNLNNVSVLTIKSLNTYELSKANYLIWTKKALQSVNKRGK